MCALQLALTTLCLLTVIPRAPQAQPSRETLLVSEAWLAQHITDPDLVLLHVGDAQEYETRHLPNARFAALSDLSMSDRSGSGLLLEMLKPDQLRNRLAALGISDRSRIVVYFAQRSITVATRVVFTLDYAGLGDRVSLLDGGMDGWVAAGRPVTSTIPPPATGTLSTLKTRPIIVDADRVLQKLKTPHVSIVDARAAGFYAGAQVGGQPTARHRTGHIAGARSVPFTELFDQRIKLRPAADLRALFTNAGVKAGDTVIAYCHIGQQATALAFAARTLGHRVLLYDGSFEDWSRHADYPVEVSKQER